MKYQGFIEPKIETEHYVLGQGNVPQDILQPDSNWQDSKPEDEAQAKNGLETNNCTSFGSLSLIEMYIRKAFPEDQQINYSERWVGIISGNKGQGNDPHTVMEAIRKNGLIPEEMLPFDDTITTIEDYCSFKGADEAKCREEGKKWLEKYDFKHEWVFTNGMTEEEKINNFKIALKYSPLGIAVYAWAQDEDGVYIKLGNDNHWTTMIGLQSDVFEEVYDSYDPFEKIVRQNIVYCKRIHIDKIEPKDTEPPIWQKAIALISRFISEFKYLYDKQP